MPPQKPSPVTSSELPSDKAGAASRLLDIGAALFLLLLCAPVLLWVAAAVKMTSSGPVFYRQERVGRGGRSFRIWKFRTMFTAPVCAEEAGAGLLVTAQDDLRITPLGRHLRSWKLDEMPQLFNVVRGEMSLVGPRPQVPRFADRFDPSLRQIVLSVRPGITGPTALYFRHEEFLLSGRLDREQFYLSQIMPVKLQMDAEYTRCRSLGTDLQVLADTAHLVLSRLVGRAGRSGIPTATEMSALHSAEAAELAQQTAELAQMADMAREDKLSRIA